MGCGLPFRPGVFDGCISISAIQWLCYSSKKEHTARKRLMRFFSSLYGCLKRGSRAVLQLYPETPTQMEEISSCAMRCGFSGGLVIDFPNSTKAKKYYLCLFAGFDASPSLPKALGTTDERLAPSEQQFEGRRAQNTVRLINIIYSIAISLLSHYYRNEENEVHVNRLRIETGSCLKRNDSESRVRR